jgi:hypothetical protein
MSDKSYNPDDARVNVVLRLCGMLFFALGLGFIYETYTSAAAEVIQPPLVPVYYLCAIMLVLAGSAAIIAKYKPSTPPKP